MTNDSKRIGQLGMILINMEDSRREMATPKYAALLAEYTALKAKPENWEHVRESKHTPEQAALCAAWKLANPVQS